MEIVDYAYPTMMAENALKAMHEAMLSNDYDKALEQALIAITETRIAYQSIRHMKDTEK
jgi:hypothetical protein